MTFPTAKLDFIPNPVNFTQDWLLPAVRLAARALAVREGTEQPSLCAELTGAPSPRYRAAFPHKILHWDFLELPLASTEHKYPPAWGERVSHGSCTGTPETALEAFISVFWQL